MEVEKTPFGVMVLAPGEPTDSPGSRQLPDGLIDSNVCRGLSRGAWPHAGPGSIEKLTIKNHFGPAGEDHEDLQMG